MYDSRCDYMFSLPCWFFCGILIFLEYYRTAAHFIVSLAYTDKTFHQVFYHVFLNHFSERRSFCVQFFIGYTFSWTTLPVYSFLVNVTLKKMVFFWYWICLCKYAPLRTTISSLHAQASWLCYKFWILHLGHHALKSLLSNNLKECFLELLGFCKLDLFS